MDRLRHIKDRLIAEACERVDHGGGDMCELGQLIDMIKDVCEIESHMAADHGEPMAAMSYDDEGGYKPHSMHGA